MQNQSFGVLLREVRDKQGISMRALAKSADMDPAYLSRIENGKSGEPQQETVEKLAQALCDVQELSTEQCERQKRQLLVAAGHLQDKADLIDDLAERFAARLRDEGFPEAHIDEAVARVPYGTMRAVLLGEEKLEIGDAAAYSPAKLRSRRESGEEVHAFSLERTLMRSEPSQSAMNLSVSSKDSATDYLDRHATDFTTKRREQRARASGGPRKTVRAGRDATILINKDVNKEQEQQLRLIGKLIDSILQESK